MFKLNYSLIFILSSLCFLLQSSEIGNNYDMRLFSDDIKIVQKAIDENADVNAIDEFNRTALIRAASCNKLDIVKLLIDARANVNATDNFGNTALIMASNGKVDIVKLLIKYEADISAKTESFITAVMIAESRKNEEIVKLIMDKIEYLKKAKEEVDNYLSNSSAQILPATVSDIINQYL